MIKRALFLTIILVLFSFVLRAVSTQHPMPLKKSLAEFPSVIDGYRVADREEMDKRVIKVLGVDDYLMWTYCRNGFCIDLYIGYFTQQEKGAMIHSPKHCMPGGGWAPISSKIITIKTKEGTYRINRYLLQKDEDKILVYYWYEGRGRVVADELHDRLYLLWDRLIRRRTDGALVRLIVPYTPENERRLQEFTKALFPILKEYLPS